MFVEIKTPLPGPKNRAVIERDSKFMSPSYTRDYPLVIERGEGVTVYDPDGNKFLDLTAGIAVCATGHSHPRVVRAITEQAQKFLHMSGTDFYYEVQVNLAEKLAEITPVRTSTGRKRAFFTNSGAEAIEAALKLSRYITGRRQIIAFYGSFHGRTMGALSLTASKMIQSKGYFPFVPGITHIPYAYCYRCPFGQTNNPTQEDVTCSLVCISYLEDVVFRSKVDPEDVAAIFVEPIQGEGGYVVPPKRFIKELRAICDKYGILLVDDEIQTGMGRTGKWFGIEHFDTQPDIICIAKGIASGMPLGAIISSDEVMSWEYGSHASTFGGNPVSCAAALATIELIENGLLENAKIVGNYFKGLLTPLAQKYEEVAEVRGKGLMIGIEFIKNKQTKERYPELRNKLVLELYNRGVLTLGCGHNNLRLAPALILTQEQAAFATGIIDESINKLVH